MKRTGILAEARRRIVLALMQAPRGGRMPIQVAALPWRRGAEGQVEVLLITSRSSGQWIVPKGRPMRRKTLAQSAAVEAFEEGGVRGVVEGLAIGEFLHRKRHWMAGSLDYRVIIFPLRVQECLDAWPEQAERTRKWASRDEAAALVRSEQLATILKSFEP